MPRCSAPSRRARQNAPKSSTPPAGATAPTPFVSAYGASKASVVRFTETLAGELQDCGIAVNALAPGALNTRMLDEILEAAPNKVGQAMYDKAGKQKAEGGASVQRAAECCAYLLSDASDGITGKLISAVLGPWETLADHTAELGRTDVYTLRRIVPEDILREALKVVGADDLPLDHQHGGHPGTHRPGSFGSFTTALLRALHTHKKNLVHRSELAKQACEIEIDRLGEPIGKQDRYIAAYGGITCFNFRGDDSVEACPLRLSTASLHNLEDNLILFFTGFARSAGSMLKHQDVKSKEGESAMTDNLHFIKDLGVKSKEALEAGCLSRFAELMDVHWEWKKQRSPNMSNGQIDEWYELARANGALGGKLIGAGGGFLMFYAEDQMRLRHALVQAGLREVRFRFDLEGTKTIVQ